MGVRVRIAAAAAAVAAGLVAAGLAEGRSAAIAFFKTPSGNIGCIWTNDPHYLRCDIRSGLRPMPRKPSTCDLDYGHGLSMRRTSKAGPLCAGDTALDPRAPVLGYGKTWRKPGFSCTSRTSGLTCTNQVGHGWFLSRESWRVF